MAADPARIEPDTKQDEVELIRGDVKEEVATVDIFDNTPEERTAQQSAVKKEEMEATGRTEPGQIESGYFLHLRTFGCPHCATLSLAGMASCYRRGAVIQSAKTDGLVSKFTRLQMRWAQTVKDEGGVAKHMTSESMLIAAKQYRWTRFTARSTPSSWKW